MSTLLWPYPLTRVTSEFGWRPATAVTPPMHHPGMDFSATLGEAVPSAGAGTVAMTGTDSSGALFVIVDHPGGIRTRYWHLSRIAVTRGQAVVAGQTLGGAGATGLATGVHLHFEVLVNTNHTNPREVIGLAAPNTEQDDRMKLWIGRLHDTGDKLWLFGPRGRVHITDGSHPALIERYMRTSTDLRVPLAAEADIALSYVRAVW